MPDVDQRLQRIESLLEQIASALPAAPSDLQEVLISPATGLISKRDLAERLDVSLATIDRGLRRGWPHARLGRLVRFSPADVKKIERSLAVKDLTGR
jgi:DNA-directed RNA polymerase specialized sigma24 family protein